MPRIDLFVAFAEKDEAKRLGARWDPEARRWYVPEDVDPTPFTKWLKPGSVPETDKKQPPPAVQPNIRAPSFYIMESSEPCWRCKRLTRVFGFELPENHEELNDEIHQFEPADCACLVSEIKWLSPAAINRIRELSIHYRSDYSATAETSYWMNHCEHCGAKIGDWYLYSEPGGAFCPIDEEAAKAIKRRRYGEAFEAEADSVHIRMD